MTQTILSIDTTAGTSVSITRGETCLAFSSQPNGLKHAETIGDSIAKALKLAELEPGDIDAVAVGRGPALFTGLRVGIAAGIMFAQAVGAKLVGVVSHDAIALEKYRLDASLPEQPLFIYTDARRGEIYWALYGGLDHHGLPIVLAGPSVGKHQQVVDDLTMVHGQITEVTGEAFATWVGRLAALQKAAGVSSQDVSALYLRAPDATEPNPNKAFGKRVSS
jgi:tRNA threonylcarbamoyl adenosine modification protein YeaZ